MKTAAQRAAKRHLRENRDNKRDTWKCSGCGGRHPLNERCPIPRREAVPVPLGGLELAAIAALGAVGKRRGDPA